MFVSFNSNTMGVTGGVGNAYPSASELTTVFSAVHAAQSLVF